VKAKDLVWMVEELKASVWRSSLLWREVEIVLEKIVDHAVLFSDLYDSFSVCCFFFAVVVRLEIFVFGTTVVGVVDEGFWDG